MNPAILVLEDGTIYEGEGFGAETDAVFELVFNTSMTGYQEIMTDPSYRGQGVLFTVPHLGNVGVNLEDYEAGAPQVSAVICRELSGVVSNWRARVSLADWLQTHSISGIQGISTRSITHRLRSGGTLKAAISTCGTPAADLLARVRAWGGLDGLDMVAEVTCKDWYTWGGDAADAWVAQDLRPQRRFEFPRPPVVVVIDYGVKRNMIRHLAAWGAGVVVVPAAFSAAQVLAFKPDGILLSNGPGDPAGLPYAVDTVRELVESRVPVFGICLGHQLLGRALGGQTSRLKFGHHGGNHPVLDVRTRRVLITSQNHNFVVDTNSLPTGLVETTHYSLNDQSLEGMALPGRRVFSVQFHPESAPGPHDAHGLFEAFFENILEGMAQ